MIQTATKQAYLTLISDDLFPAVTSCFLKF